MADGNDKKQHFIDLLHELFQLGQPELNFGFYKIMHAKSWQIQRFINEELSQYIDEALPDKAISLPKTSWPRPTTPFWKRSARMHSKATN